MTVISRKNINIYLSIKVVFIIITLLALQVAHSKPIKNDNLVEPTIVTHSINGGLGISFYNSKMVISDTKFRHIKSPQYPKDVGLWFKGRPGQKGAADGFWDFIKVTITPYSKQITTIEGSVFFPHVKYINPKDECFKLHSQIKSQLTLNHPSLKEYYEPQSANPSITQNTYAEKISSFLGGREMPTNDSRRIRLHSGPQVNSEKKYIGHLLTIIYSMDLNFDDSVEHEFTNKYKEISAKNLSEQGLNLNNL